MPRHFAKYWMTIGRGLFGTGLLGGAVLFVGGSASSGPAEPVVSAREVETIAQVNGQEVSLERYNDLVDAMLRKARLGDGNVPGPIQRAIKLELAERLIRERLVEEAASERGILAQESDIDAALARFKAAFDSESDFDQTVAQYPLGLKEIRQRLRIRWLQDRLVEAEFPPLTEEIVQSFYDRSPARFDTPEHCVVRDIFLRSDRQQTAAERRAKRERAEQLRKLARSSEMPFEKLARQYSEGPTATTGGDMGPVTSRTVETSVWESLATLKPGGISEVVEAPDGFHILLLVERKSSVRRSFAEVKPQVWAELHAHIHRQRKDALMVQLSERAHIANLLAQRLGAPSITRPTFTSVADDDRTPFDALAGRTPPSPGALKARLADTLFTDL